VTLFGFGFGGNRRQCHKPKHTSFRFRLVSRSLFSLEIHHYLSPFHLVPVIHPTQPNPTQATTKQKQLFVD
jgi:hypothetical protein